ncbi:DNA adenine methylase [Serratia symbiotica]|uniref:DNA adenine methylase n=1 Tax=Serratia symbiotica TaxID=138074 RepID=UPI00298FF213|nr:DNA adenine methylase [Serratia symbiotica]
MHTPVLRYHGGKFRLFPWLHRFFPEHEIYVEPFGGAASVLLRKPRSHGEVYNDLDQDIFNLFRVLRDEKTATRLRELCESTPYSRDEFQLAYQHTDDPVERARRTIVRSAMGFGSGAATGHKTGFRCEARRKYATSANVWDRYPPVLTWVAQRLRGVNIENREASQCISSHDTAKTFIYVDPPYMMETRTIGSSGHVYRHEMTEQQHVELLEQLQGVKGMVTLSGYASELYNDMLTGWRCETKQARISARVGTGIKTECLWLNPQCQAVLERGTLYRYSGSRKFDESRGNRPEQEKRKGD